VTKWWWPTPGVSYWPERVPSEETVEAFTAAFATLGYEPCSNGGFEDGFEKLAIYAQVNGAPSHMARQLPGGRWTSKLGSDVDIMHEALTQVEGSLYGHVVAYMKRRRS